jgi:hypothetical protein
MKHVLFLISILLHGSLWAADVLTIPTDYVDLRLIDNQLTGLNEAGQAYKLLVKNRHLEDTAYGFPQAEPRPDDILSDGLVVNGPGDIQKAWLGGPTERYDHGVLADQIEASMLYAVDARQITHRIELGSQLVFEDRSPRYADLDADGLDELIVIRTNINSGAGVASYGLNNGELVLEAASETIGLSHRWLNIVGIEDFNADGKAEIAAVITPHIGGTLTLFQQNDEKLEPVLEQYGFSNHENGSREQGMSAVYDFNADGVLDMAVPDANRQNLIVLTARGNQFNILSTITNKTRIKSGIYVTDIDEDTLPELVYLLADKTLVIVRLQ